MNETKNLQITLERLLDPALFEKYHEISSKIIFNLDKTIEGINKEHALVNLQSDEVDAAYSEFEKAILGNDSFVLNNISQRQIKFIATSSKLLKNEIIFEAFYSLVTQRVTQRTFIRLISNYLITYNSIPQSFIKKIKIRLSHLYTKIIDTENVRSILTPFDEKQLFFSDTPEKSIYNHMMLNKKLEDLSIISIQKFFVLGIGDLYANFIYYIFNFLIKNFSKHKNKILDEILIDPKLAKDILSKIVGEIICAVDKTNSEDKDKTTKIVLNLIDTSNQVIFGDPRLYKEKWELVPSESVSLFKGWLNKKNIEFFFSVIFDENKDTASNRKDFWLRYAKYVIDIKFFISDEHLHRSYYIIEEAKKNTGLNYGKTIYSTNQASIFIMEFPLFYVIEASTSGALALRIYAKDSQIQPNSKDFKQIFNAKRVSIADLRAEKADSIDSETMARRCNIVQNRAIKFSHGENWGKLVATFLSLYGMR